MDYLRLAAVVFCLLFAVTDGNHLGPPVSTSNVCKDMFPQGHGVAAQQGEDAVNITLAKDCYDLDTDMLD